MIRTRRREDLMIESYRVIKEIPRHFINCLPVECPTVKAGEICRYFKHSNTYIFDARERYVPWIERRYVELWTGELFEPLEPAVGEF